MKNIIFHHPLPLNYQAKSASGIRPVKMLEAFQKCGLNVIPITGYGKERKAAIKKVKRQVKNGVKFDFVYSESSTQPTLLTEKNHLPLYPFLDFNFFNFCKKNDIKIGLFYRDIHWVFPFYDKRVSLWKSTIAKFFYKYDIKQYRKYLSVLYLPSTPMSSYIPDFSGVITKELPPAHSLSEKSHKDETSHFPEKKLNLLYVGGLGEIYQMQEIVPLINQNERISFTLCTRREEWEKNKSHYKETKSIRVIHKSGTELEQEYQTADIAMLFVKPGEYWKFAIPVKLFEYIGYQLPIICSDELFIADFIKSNNIGWTIPYSSDAIIQLTKEIIDNPESYQEKKRNITKISSNHTWEARAKQVINDLS